MVEVPAEVLYVLCTKPTENRLGYLILIVIIYLKNCVR